MRHPRAASGRLGTARRLAEVAGELSSYRETAGLDAFQINFHGNRNLDQLLQSMECFMQDVAPIASAERIGSKS
jgi:exopolyphosphatase/pppGpp-phosphohydrolase